jgi:hypothetical protein
MTTPEERQKALLTDSHRRAVLVILNEAEAPLDVTELADRLVRRNETIVSSSAYERQVEQERVSLHHNYLPSLADAGLVEYDRERNTASITNGAADDIEWYDDSMVDELLAQFRTGSGNDESSVGVIEGRQSVIEYGRVLADAADRELFLLYGRTDFLEDECLRRAEDALDRGVHISLGSRNPEVRDLTRERLPEVALWEPQRDWMNELSSYPKVGRLVLVDRMQIMLSVLRGPGTEDAHPDERALVGEGEDNSLVVLARDLLGPRLDNLDHQRPEPDGELHT